MQEIETKILDINKEEIITRLRNLGAKEMESVRLTIDWYAPAGTKKEGPHPWCFRVRNSSNGKVEMTWKSMETFVGDTARHSNEINLNVSDFEKAKILVEAIGFMHYAHQEKDRHSFHYKNWNFDIDTYPNMPTYLEIEGESESSINEAIKLLDLEKHIALAHGEIKIIKDRYNLDWYNMTFKG